jgi:predicted amidophosphoribosyltransferase
MKCTCCGEEAEKIYRVLDSVPVYVCKQCALNWGETDTVCIDCGTQLGRTAYELHGRYYCEQCFLREAEITEGE